MQRMIAGIKRGFVHAISKKRLFNAVCEMCIAALFGFGGIKEFAPLGAAAVAGAYIWHGKFIPASIGVFIGALLGGQYQTVSLVPLYIGLSLLYYLWRGKLRRVEKLMLLCTAQFLLMPFFSMYSIEASLVALANICASALCAIICSGGGRAVVKLLNKKAINDSDNVFLLLLSLLITASLACGGFDSRAAALFASIVALIAVGTVGLNALAAAVLLSAAYMLGGSQDALSFMCVLSLSSFAAAFFIKYGKWAALGAFMSVSGIMCYTFSLSISMLIISLCATLVFSIFPKKYMILLCIPKLEKRKLASETTLAAMRKKLTTASVVFKDIASQYTMSLDKDAPYTIRQLMGIGDMLKMIANENGREGKQRFSVELGTAACSKEGSCETGDSMAIREVNGNLLLLLSDGMGTGALAHKESASAVAMFGDLLSVGFGIDEAEEWVNRVLMMKTEHDMYATLDALLLDMSSGETHFVKFGAPPAYVVRSGKIHSIYSEALPMGILSDIRPAVHVMKLHKGDTVIMMTDGVTDALGQELYASIIEKACAANTANDAAKELMVFARERDTSDDMSIIIARVA